MSRQAPPRLRTAPRRPRTRPLEQRPYDEALPRVRRPHRGPGRIDVAPPELGGPRARVPVRDAVLRLGWDTVTRSAADDTAAKVTVLVTAYHWPPCLHTITMKDRQRLNARLTSRMTVTGIWEITRLPSSGTRDQRSSQAASITAAPAGCSSPRAT
jgi:hypothetical protein